LNAAARRRRPASVSRAPRARLAWITAVVLAGACHGSPPELRDYLLAERAPETVAARRDLPALRVKPLAARSFLDRREIAWREGDVIAGAYRYHRWSEPPAEMVTRALIDELRAGGRFGTVDGSAPRATAPFSVGGELLGLHETTDARGGAPQGVAELEVTLEEEARGSASPRHWTVRARRSVAAADDSIDARVAALSEAAAQAVGAVARELESTAAAALESR
jgi:uncharacterized lipoprotein YmbA